jgi:hypothetical protein
MELVRSNRILSALFRLVLLLAAGGQILSAYADPTPTQTPLPPECEGILDGGFEAGRPNPHWTETSSTSQQVLSSDSLRAHGGIWFASFGGSFLEPLDQSLEQTVTLPIGGAALCYYLRIPEASTDEADFLSVVIDSSEIARYTIHSGTSASYAKVTHNLSAFADGGIHTIRFISHVTGAPITSFRIDDVSVNLCIQQEPTSTPTHSPTPTETETPGGASLFEYSVRWTDEHWGVMDLIEYLEGS